MTLGDIISLLTAVFYMLLIVAQTSLSFGLDIFSFFFSKKWQGFLADQPPVVVQPDSDRATVKLGLTVDTTACTQPECHSRPGSRRSPARARRAEGRRGSPVSAEWRVAFPQANKAKGLVLGLGSDAASPIHERIMSLPMKGAHRKGQERKAAAWTQAQAQPTQQFLNTDVKASSRVDDDGSAFSEKIVSLGDMVEPLDGVAPEKHPEDRSSALASPGIDTIPSLRLTLPDGQQTDDQSVIFRVGSRRLGSSAYRARQPRVSTTHSLRLP
ncbi:hypothetical protein CONPUDRAFT_76026 [Coniophora puteana RWD-64-598 SS2]|uniref:Uncharacterized protein n=1 Tax=Coniophora puteana (strain RWD-64-598) TaxID=741705 RepID=A0A5M3MF86_CONPW|nr:uncharacterized protein CONPUDRAFT_76026 [Coniophora puteana RWD-64-598 SS2]EIW77251.1 hypothetical protein CONPUDRAFT_76026 [Coniophora puteana RWD-64-598 SS2]